MVPHPAPKTGTRTGGLQRRRDRIDAGDGGHHQELGRDRGDGPPRARVLPGGRAVRAFLLVPQGSDAGSPEGSGAVSSSRAPERRAAGGAASPGERTRHRGPRLGAHQPPSLPLRTGPKGRTRGRPDPERRHLQPAAAGPRQGRNRPGPRTEPPNPLGMRCGRGLLNGIAAVASADGAFSTPVAKGLLIPGLAAQGRADRARRPGPQAFGCSESARNGSQGARQRGGAPRGRRIGRDWLLRGSGESPVGGVGARGSPGQDAVRSGGNRARGAWSAPAVPGSRAPTTATRARPPPAAIRSPQRS